jgi:hypothetical protein
LTTMTLIMPVVLPVAMARSLPSKSTRTTSKRAPYRARACASVSPTWVSSGSV